MTDFLTENAKFICSASGMVTCKENGNSQGLYQGTKILTDTAREKSRSGVCLLQPLPGGGFKPCNCSITGWNGTNSKANAQGNSTLLQSSTANCAIGGVLSVVNSGVGGQVVKGSSSTGATLAGLTAVALGAFKQASQQETSTRGTSVEVKPQKLSRPSDKAVPTKAESKKPVPNKLFCNMDQGEKCKTCPYPHASTEVNNDSLILRSNFLKKTEAEKDKYDRHYEAVLGDREKRYWTDAAHHIISGNQVFKKAQEIVRLANFYGYDINNAGNCIMLVSKDKEYSHKNADPVAKNVSAYDAMNVTGLQWHLGGHEYTFNADEIPIIKQQIRIRTKKEAEELKNYTTLVGEELQQLQASMLRHKTCRATEQQKQAFLQRLQNISAKVKKYLGDFQEKPHHSYPFYVSREAYRYTFDLPRTGKLIVVLPGRNEHSLILEKFRIQRFQDTISDTQKNLSFKSISNGKEANPQEFDLSTEKGQRDCIIFCDNILHFIHTGATYVSLLPFKLPSEMILSIPDFTPPTLQALQAKDTEILVFLRNQRQYGYQSAYKIIKERLEEMASL